METRDPRLRTLTQIAEDLSVPANRIEYVIRARGIEPSHRIGSTRVFDAEAVHRIVEELVAIRRRRREVYRAR